MNLTNFNTTLLSWESETTIFVIFVIPHLKSVFKEVQTEVTCVVMSIMHKCSRVLVPSVWLPCKSSHCNVL